MSHLNLIHMLLLATAVTLSIDHNIADVFLQVEILYSTTTVDKYLCNFIATPLIGTI